MRIEIISIGDLVCSGLPRGMYLPIHIFQKTVNLKHYKKNCYLSVVTDKYEEGPVNITIRNQNECYKKSRPEVYTLENLIEAITLSENSIIFHNCKNTLKKSLNEDSGYTDLSIDSYPNKNSKTEYRISEVCVYNSKLETVINNKSVEKQKNISKNLESLKTFVLNFKAKSSIFLKLIDTDFKKKVKQNDENYRKAFTENSYLLRKSLNKKVLEGSQYINSGNILKAVRLFRGLGEGFTPAGDDFLMGLLLAINFKRAVKLKTQKNQANNPALDKEETNKLKNQILKTAYYKNDFIDYHLRLISDGRVSLKIKLMIEWILSGSESNMKKSIIPILNTGHSSGIDLVCGFITGLNYI